MMIIGAFPQIGYDGLALAQTIIVLSVIAAVLIVCFVCILILRKRGSRVQDENTKS